MLKNVKIVDGDTFIIWDEQDQEVLRLPLLALQNFNPGICATEILTVLLKDPKWSVVPIEDLAREAANAAKKIRDTFTDGQNETA